jgi:hypothetical protein
MEDNNEKVEEKPQKEYIYTRGYDMKGNYIFKITRTDGEEFDFHE